MVEVTLSQSTNSRPKFSFHLPLTSSATFPPTRRLSSKPHLHYLQSVTFESALYVSCTPTSCLGRMHVPQENTAERRSYVALPHTCSPLPRLIITRGANAMEADTAAHAAFDTSSPRRGLSELSRDAAGSWQTVSFHFQCTQETRTCCC